MYVVICIEESSVLTLLRVCKKDSLELHILLKNFNSLVEDPILIHLAISKQLEISVKIIIYTDIS